MPRPSDKDRVAADQRQINAGTRITKEWEERWSTDFLERAYYGEQWENESSLWEQRRYVINMLYPAIEISKPSLLFQVPKFTVRPRMTRTDDPMSDAAARAKLQEETLNTAAQDPRLGFAIETGLALLDGMFRYAVVQVGYTADYVDNPNAGRPMLNEPEPIRDKDGNPVMEPSTGRPMMDAPKPMVGRDGQPVMEPNANVRDESLFLKWIPAKQCRVSERNGNRREDCDWFAYYEWHYADDLKNNPRYSKRAKATLQPTGRAKSTKDPAARSDDEIKPGMVKTWFKWDFRKKQRRIFAEGAEAYLLEESFSFWPCAVLKFNEILGQWHPLPVIYNWMHPQNQLNDMREKRRQHRNRALPKYLRRDNAFENEEEFDKLMESEEGVSAVVQGDIQTAVFPVPLSSLDNSMFRDEDTVLQDFTRVSGISGEAQQVAQSETATQANLIALMGQLRDNAKRMVVGQFVSEIGRLMLLTMRENMALPIWVKRSVDPNSPLAMLEAQEVTNLWYQIEAEGLGEIDMDITVELSSMSPVQQAQERQDFLAFLTLITSPQVGMVLLASPALFRKVAGMFNIHDERMLSELARAVEAIMMMQATAMAGKAGASPSTSAPAPGPTPTNGDIQGQLSQQLPTEMISGVQ